MATNKELEKGKKLLKDTREEVGFLDNAFKTLGATITAAIEEAIDSATGLDDISQKIAKSYQQDITNSIKKSTKGLEDQVELTLKINAGKNVGAEIDAKLTENQTRREVTLEKINQLEGISEEQKKRLEEKTIDIFDAEERSLTKLKESNDERQKNLSLLDIAKNNASGIADQIDKSGQLSKVLTGGLASVLTPARALELIVVGIFKAFLDVDKQTSELAKSLNVNIGEAVKLRTELNMAASMSRELSVTSEGLQKSLIAINSETDAFNTTIDDNLILFTKLQKTAGLTSDELMGIQNISVATGTSLEDNTKEILAQAKITSKTLGVAINEKKVLTDISKVSNSVKLALGGSAAAIAEAVTTTKALGLELSTVESAADGFLNFEQSIQDEMMATMLLGREINLNKARQLALDDNLAGLAKEISSIAGTSAEFSKLDRIEKQVLADTLNMSKEELANMLFISDQIVGLTKDEAEERSKIIEGLQAKGLSQEQIKVELGKQALDDLKDQNGVQDNLNKGVAKLKDLFASIATPLMSIINPIVSVLIPAVESLMFILTPLFEGFNLLGSAVTFFVDKLKEGNPIALALVGTFAAFKAKAIAGAIASIFQGFSLLGPAGPPLALIAAAGMLSLIAKAAKADDLLSPGSNQSGYGDRTLFGPEGAIALNNKDTIIAGTNLRRGDDVVSTPAGSINMGQNEAKKTNELLARLLAAPKPQPIIKMNDVQLGTAVDIGAFSIQ